MEDFQTNFNILGRVITQFQERDDDVALAEKLFSTFQMVCIKYFITVHFIKLVKELLMYNVYVGKN